MRAARRSPRIRGWAARRLAQRLSSPRSWRSIAVENSPTEPVAPTVTPAPTSTPTPGVTPTPIPIAPLVAVSLCCNTGVFLVPDTRQMTAKATFADGHADDVTAGLVNWRTSNAAAATVNGAGLVQSVATGTTEVRATYGTTDVAIILDVLTPFPPVPPQAPSGAFFLGYGSDQVQIPKTRQIFAY